MQLARSLSTIKQRQLYLSNWFCPSAKISISDRAAWLWQIPDCVVTISMTKLVARLITGRRRYEPCRTGLRGWT